MSELIAMSELNGQEVAGISWDTDLPPYTPADRIGVNVRALGRIARLAGFEPLAISSFAGRTDQFTPEMSGQTPDGAALASGRAHRQKGESHRVASTDPDRTKQARFHKMVSGPGYDVVSPTLEPGSIILNSAAIVNRLSQKGQLRSASGWARELNREIVSAGRAAALQNLTSPMGAAYLAGSEAYIISSSASHAHNPVTYLSSVAAYNLCVPVVYGLWALTFRGTAKETRYSMLLGNQYDRVGLVYGATAVQRLVKPLG